jgi:hypothetical protein
MEEVNTQESWNKKRIFIALFLVTLLVVGGLFIRIRFLGENSSKMVEQAKEISVRQGANPVSTVNIQEAMKEKIDSLKQQVSGLDVSEIATSSPQVQKILNDIKSLGQYPTNQVKEICRKICGL